MRVGIDFGTTNSGIAISDGAKIHTFKVDESLPDLLPSIIYITKHYEDYVGTKAREVSLKQNTGRPSRYEKYWVGEVDMWVSTATNPKKVKLDVYAWIDVLSPGRLINSVKSALRNQDYEGTNIFGEYYSIEELISIILKHLVRSVELALGRSVKEAVIGRPVKFSDKEAVNQRAEEIIQKASKLAGIEKVRFLPEPIAAAYDVHRKLEQQKCTLVFDFGGGTLDLTLAMLGGASPPQILATEGVLVGGDDFDRRIFQHLLSHFGMGATFSNGKPIPAHIWDTVLNWEVTEGQQIADAIEFVQEVVRSGKNSDPKGLKALEELLSQNLQYKLLQEIIQAKIELSTEESSLINFSEKTIDICERITRNQFEIMIQPEIRIIEDAIEKLVETSGRNLDEIELVVKTGGSSQIPKFSKLLREKFPSATLSGEEESVLTGVVKGLAIFGNDLDEEEDNEIAAKKSKLIKNIKIAKPSIIINDRDEKNSRLVAGLNEAGIIYCYPWHVAIPNGESDWADNPMIQGVLCNRDSSVLLGTLWSRFFLARASDLLKLTKDREKTPPYLKIQDESLDSKYIGDKFVLIAKWGELKTSELLLLITKNGNARHFRLSHIKKELDMRREWHLSNLTKPDIPTMLMPIDKSSEVLLISESGRAVRISIDDLPIKGTRVIKLNKSEAVYAAQVNNVQRCIVIDKLGIGISILVNDVSLSSSSTNGKLVYRGGNVVALLPDTGKQKAFALTSLGRVVELEIFALRNSKNSLTLAELRIQEFIVNCWLGYS